MDVECTPLVALKMRAKGAALAGTEDSIWPAFAVNVLVCTFHLCDTYHPQAHHGDLTALGNEAFLDFPKRGAMFAARAATY